MKKTSSKKKTIENYILNKIKTGELKRGQPIPSELELAQQFGYGRQTIHSALADLALMGIIDRTPGKGSFVKNVPVKRNIQQKMSFTQDMEAMGMKAGSRLLEYKLLKASDCRNIIEDMNIDEKQMIHYFVRLRTGDGTPIALQYNYVLAKYLPEIDLSALQGSLEEYLEKIGLVVTGFVTKLKAIEANEEQMQLLQSNSKSVLNSISIRYIDENTPLQYTSTLYRSDLYEYTFSSFR